MNDFELLKELLKSDRSIRRFRQEKVVDTDTLEELVDLTRYCASGRNLQPLRYRIVNTTGECNAIFPALKWAGYLTDWEGPREDERPAAYLIQCLDTDITTNLLCDDGIQLQALTLGATTKGLGTCIIKSFNVQIIRTALNLPENMKPLYVLALGFPEERVTLEDMDSSGEIKYWRDEEGQHHVPKRKLSDLIIG